MTLKLIYKIYMTHEEREARKHVENGTREAEKT